MPHTEKTRSHLWVCCPISILTLLVGAPNINRTDWSGWRVRSSVRMRIKYNRSELMTKNGGHRRYVRLGNCDKHRAALGGKESLKLIISFINLLCGGPSHEGLFFLAHNTTSGCPTVPALSYTLTFMLCVV